MPQKIIRDPVHDVIAFQLDRPLDGLLFRLINAREFQRLRRIRQLGLTPLAYPGADHSRYSHSLGVMETARRILEHLRHSIKIDERAEVLLLVGALLHDLGHGPFSHVFERISGIHHEDVTRHMILDEESDVHALLRAFDAALPADLVAFMDCLPRRSFLNDILSSQLDADRCDYLLRDNLMTGSHYGDYDLHWLLHAFTVDAASDRLAIASKGVSAVEAFLQARYHMYRNVYFHKVVRSAEGMVRLALHRAGRLAVQERLPWPPREHPITKSLLGQSLRSDELAMLDDSSMLESFKAWTASDDPVLARLCRGLLFRRLFKVIELSHETDPARLARIRAIAEELVMQEAGDVAYDFFIDEPSDTPYETFDAGTCPSDGILVCDDQGQVTPIAEISPLAADLNRRLMFRRLHIEEGLKGEMMRRMVGEYARIG